VIVPNCICPRVICICIFYFRQHFPCDKQTEKRTCGHTELDYKCSSHLTFLFYYSSWALDGWSTTRDRQHVNINNYWCRVPREIIEFRLLSPVCHSFLSFPQIHIVSCVLSSGTGGFGEFGEMTESGKLFCILAISSISSVGRWTQVVDLYVQSIVYHSEYRTIRIQ